MTVPINIRVQRPLRESLNEIAVEKGYPTEHLVELILKHYVYVFQEDDTPEKEPPGTVSPVLEPKPGKHPPP